MPFFYLAIAFSLNATANILLKLGSKNGINLEDKGLISLIGNNFLFLLGIFLFAVNVIFYFLALKNIPLSTAYPTMTVMSLVIINIFSIFVLNEKINSIQILGYFLITFGVILIFKYSQNWT